MKIDFEPWQLSNTEKINFRFLHFWDRYPWRWVSSTFWRIHNTPSTRCGTVPSIWSAIFAHSIMTENISTTILTSMGDNGSHCLDLIFFVWKCWPMYSLHFMDTRAQMWKNIPFILKVCREITILPCHWPFQNVF